MCNLRRHLPADRQHTRHLSALIYLSLSKCNHGQTPSRAIIINISAFMCCRTNQIIADSSARRGSIFSPSGWRPREPVRLIADRLPLHLAVAQSPPLPPLLPSPAVSALATS